MPLNVERIRALRPQNELHYWPSLPSTMIEATRLANSGAPHGTVVVTDEQTAGMGSLGPFLDLASRTGNLLLGAAALGFAAG